jgi:hypothetical protein
MYIRVYAVLMSPGIVGDTESIIAAAVCQFFERHMADTLRERQRTQPSSSCQWFICALWRVVAPFCLVFWLPLGMYTFTCQMLTRTVSRRVLSGIRAVAMCSLRNNPPYRKASLCVYSNCRCRMTLVIVTVAELPYRSTDSSNSACLMVHV